MTPLRSPDIYRSRLKDYYRGILGRKIRPLALALIRNTQGQFLFHKGHDKVRARAIINGPRYRAVDFVADRGGRTKCLPPAQTQEQPTKSCHKKPSENGPFIVARALKREYFYRPLGGGIEFSESGKVALEREIVEELNQEVHVSGLTASFENIFIFDGLKGHEIIMLFSEDFKNKSVYQQRELDIFESGVVIAKSV